MSYSRWATELLFLANVEQMNAELFNTDSMLKRLGYTEDNNVYGVLVLLGMAILLRLAAMLLLRRSATQELS